MRQYRKIETNESKKTIKKTVILMSVLILIGIAVLIGTSYALFSTTLHGEKKVSIQTGTFQVEMTDGEYIKEESMGTMTDKEGKKTKPYTFTITNTSTETIGAYYRLYLIEESGNLNTYYIKYELKGNDGSQKEGRIGTLSSFYINKYLEAKESITYELRLWLDEETPNSEQGKNYQSKIAVEGNQVEKKYTGVETLLTNFTNEENAEYSDTTKDKMFVFHHEAGAQQEGWSPAELTDYRYIGKDPNNYVTFNGEEAGWRIIGIFTVENEKGEKEQRIKLISDRVLRTNNGIFISWDNKLVGEGSSESIAGSNDWTDSRLMMLLNPGYETNPLASGGKGSLYWNRESGFCPLGSDGAIAACDFRNVGLTATSQSMIGNTKYYLGMISDTSIDFNKIYLYERGNETCKTVGTCTTERSIFWIGKIGLMYPSDYGYATSGENNKSRDKCLLSSVNDYISNGCHKNNWIYVNQTNQWTITACSSNSSRIRYIGVNGHVPHDDTFRNYDIVRPSFYLTSDVQIQGTGSKNDPFVFTK